MNIEHFQKNSVVYEPKSYARAFAKGDALSRVKTFQISLHVYRQLLDKECSINSLFRKLAFFYSNLPAAKYFFNNPRTTKAIEIKFSDFRDKSIGQIFQKFLTPKLFSWNTSSNPAMVGENLLYFQAKMSKK